MGFTPHKAEQSLQGKELQENEEKEDKKVYKKDKGKKDLLTLDLKAFTL